MICAHTCYYNVNSVDKKRLVSFFFSCFELMMSISPDFLRESHSEQANWTIRGLRLY